MSLLSILLHIIVCLSSANSAENIRYSFTFDEQTGFESMETMNQMGGLMYAECRFGALLTSNDL